MDRALRAAVQALRDVARSAGHRLRIGQQARPGDSGPHIAVDKQGFSQQPTGYNGGSNLSYGLLLKNTSTSEDATQVYLLINFATASGELIGTVTRTIELIGAGQLYALGDSAVLRTETPVAKLEVTIRVMAHAKAKPLPMPHFVNVRILPDQNQPDYVGEVDGEVVNDTSPFMMNSARLSIVLLNTAGEIVGGGSGHGPLAAAVRVADGVPRPERLRSGAELGGGGADHHR